MFSMPVIQRPFTIQEWAVIISILVFLFGSGIIFRLIGLLRNLIKEKKTQSPIPNPIYDIFDRGDPPHGTRNSDKIQSEDRRKMSWIQKRFKAVITAYAAGLWIIVLLTAISNTPNYHNYFAPPMWLLIILLGFLLVGLIIAFLSHIDRLKSGIYLGILYPLSLPICYLIFQALGGVIYLWEGEGVYVWEKIHYLNLVEYWLIPVAILTTVLLWQTRK
jgi:hypothetical protein